MKPNKILLTIAFALIIVFGVIVTNNLITDTANERLILNPHLLARTFETGTVNEAFKADAYTLVNIVEETHPIFGFPHMLDDEYERIRNEFLHYAARAVDEIDFLFEIMRYFRVLRDGHMALQFSEIPPKFLDCIFVVVGNELYLSENSGDTLSRVVSIGGVYVGKVIATIETYFYFENMADRQHFLSTMPRNKLFLQRAGMGNEPVVVKVQDSEGTRDVVVDWLTIGDTTNHPPVPIFHHEKMEDVMYIRIREMAVQQPELDNLLWAIRDEVRDGVRNFIVDLRYNTGGKSLVNSWVLNAMGIMEPTIGIYRRYSPLSLQQRATNERMPASAHYGGIAIVSKPTTETAVNSNDVTVAVLTTAVTYSAATLFAVSVQDGGFGVVVGEASRNAPDAFGDMLLFTLPYTQINLDISYSRFVRPDVNANQRTVVPDIEVPSADALETALAFFKNK